jgi:hypothetical protein
MAEVGRLWTDTGFHFGTQPSINESIDRVRVITQLAESSNGALAAEVLAAYGQPSLVTVAYRRRVADGIQIAE